MNQIAARRIQLVAFATAIAALAACQTTPPVEEKREVAPVAAPEVKAAPALPTSYEVVRGDHLWGIASQPRIYGNPYQWPLIYKANSSKVKDADLIHPGQSLSINRSASAADVDAAVRHAKTRGAWKLGVTEDTDTAYLAGKR